MSTSEGHRSALARKYSPSRESDPERLGVTERDMVLIEVRAQLDEFPFSEEYKAALLPILAQQVLAKRG